jgi:general L-amino acid transport system permease protein
MMPGAIGYRPPPPLARGWIGWARAHLFASPVDAVLTLFSLLLIYLCVPPVLNYVFFDAFWSGTDRNACLDHAGFCWPFITTRFEQFIYGAYPVDERWRVNVAALVGIALVIANLIRDSRFVRTRAIGLFGLWPIFCAVILPGGMFGLTYVSTQEWGGFFVTLVVAVTAIATSLPLGILLALARLSDLPLIRWLAIGFIEVIRGVPLITLLFMASLMLPMFLPQGISIEGLVRVLIGFALFAAAYMAEVVRAGLSALPKGQGEAAQALELGYWQIHGLILLPQALSLVIPAIVNTFIALLKDTTLVMVVGLMDLLGTVQAAIADPAWATPNTAPSGYILLGMVFWASCYGMSRYSAGLERRLHANRLRN